MRRLISTFLVLIITLTGNPLARGGSLINPPVTGPATTTVVEYYHAGLDHYFVTASDVEKSLLDSGATRGWVRTGLGFDAYLPNATGVVANAVCRFYGRPDAALDSHFYTASADECGAVARDFASSWQFESSNVFRIQLPDLTTGACLSGTVPVYRLFNNRRDANHRYTTDANIRDQMVAAGHIPEGYGPDSVAFCAIPNATTPIPGAPTPPSPNAPAVTVVVTQNSPETFTFAGTAVPVGIATIVARAWDHGDGTTATGMTSTHTYTASGTYQVRHTVTDSAGQSATVTKAVAAIVTAPTLPLPTVTISATQMTPDSFSFSSAAVAAVGLAITTYAWDFGDNVTASGPTATHTYAAAGNYLVKLTVTDTKGRAGNATRSLTASKTPVPPTPTGPSPTAAPGQWMKYNTSYAAGTEAEYQSWYNLAWDTKRNIAYGLSWQAVLSSFDPVAGVWRKLTPNLGATAGVHNRTTVYDPVNDRVWIGSGTGSQLVGLNYYDPNTGQFVSHSISGKTPGSEAAMIYDAAGGRFVVFGGWGRLGVHTFSLAPVASTMTSVPISGGPDWDAGTKAMSDAAKMTAWRSALDTKRNRIVYVDTDGSLWILPLTLTGWQKLATSGGPPPVFTQYVYDQSADALVGWSASPRIAGGDPTPGITQETWLLPLATLVWTKGANAAAGHAVPNGPSYVEYALIYDPVRKQTILHTIGGSNFDPSTWAYKYPSGGGAPPPPPTPPPTSTPPTVPAPPFATSYGTITSFPLPAIREAPYSSLGASKHTNMAYSPATGRLYVQGGDWLHSATDGTWSMNLTNGSWRREVGDPIYPTLPAPHALQDGAGFEWVPSRNKLLAWPGSYFPYGCSHTFTDPRCLSEVPKYNYARGMWWFDPVTNTYEQDLRLFGTVGETSRSLFGGAYDDVNDHIVVFGDSGTTPILSVRRWDVNSGTQLTDIRLTISPPSGSPTARAHYFTRGKYAKIGRHVYVIGYSTDGGAIQIARMWRWHLDTLTWEEVAAPALPGMDLKEVRPAVSKGKLVFPFTPGTDGEFPYGIHIYDPGTNTWVVDKAIPTYGNFIGNAITSLPDGRVVFSGGSFGRQQTHIWFYETR